jgi:hypothetical protein
MPVSVRPWRTSLFARFRGASVFPCFRGGNTAPPPGFSHLP